MSVADAPSLTRRLALAGCLALMYRVGPLHAQQNGKAAYIGAKACGSCHPGRLAQQSASAHARSLFSAAEHPLAGLFLPRNPLLRKPNFHLQYRLNGKEFQVQAFDDSNVIDLPVEWAFGGGDQAVTFVTRVNEDWYLEHYLTYYSAARSLAPTPGQEGLVADSLPHAMGVLYKTLDPDTGVVGCFQCHSTGPVGVGAKRELQPAELGVRCEACHGPGSLHRDAVTLGQREKVRKSIGNPRRMSASGLNQLCGTCHRRPRPPGQTADWNLAWNVRHQPVYLDQAACFRKSKGALSCLTCHDPHQDLRRDDAAYYNQKCASCHNATRPPRPVCVATKPANCIGCHMPQVSPQAYLRFTNHWIGVYGEGVRLKPIR